MNKPRINESMYGELHKAELKLADAKLDVRFGEESRFTEQTKSLELFVQNLRNELRDRADEITILNIKELKEFLERMGVHKDFIDEIHENAQVASTAAATLESALKVVHPLF